MLQIKNMLGGGKPEGLYAWKKLSAQGGAFIDYVVSDKETAYPDGGEKGGYWYEKIYSIDPKLFGFTKIAIDEFTVASRTTVYASAPFVINHSLGETPKVAFLKVKDYSQTLETGDLFFSMRIGGSIDGRTGPSSNSVDYTSYATSEPTGCANYSNVAGQSYPYIELWDSSTITIKNDTTSTTYRKYIPACDFELITMA